MNTCNYTAVSSSPCGQSNGGLKSIELSSNFYFVDHAQDNIGENITYYFKRMNKLFFKDDIGERFILVFPIESIKDIPRLKYGQRLRLKIK